jgi:SPP1 family predicted phage head-tail adaptor
MPSGLAAVNDGAGTLRHRVTFAERNTTQDEYGNPSTGWVDRCTVFAGIFPRLGGEAVDAARLAGRQPVVIRVRKSPDTKRITTDWKATDQAGKEYNIRTAIDPLLGDGAHGFYIDMLAETGVAV